jgi:hypothetical protein
VLLDGVGDARGEEPEHRARAAPAAPATIAWTFRSAATMRATVPVASTTMALPHVERSPSATSETAAPTTPPAGKGAVARSARARCARVAMQRVRTAYAAAERTVIRGGAPWNSRSAAVPRASGSTSAEKPRTP